VATATWQHWREKLFQCRYFHQLSWQAKLVVSDVANLGLINYFIGGDEGEKK